jgi:hypothetical protein
MRHHVDPFIVLHAAAGEDVMSGHESQSGVPPGEQHLQLGVAADQHAGSRLSRFGRHRVCFSSIRPREMREPSWKF